jgi:hypothetical protein
VKLHRWREFPAGIRAHLSERLLDRSITADDLDALRIWVESEPDVPEGKWYKDFGRFKICGEGPDPKTFLTQGQAALGRKINGDPEETES